ncbi:MAG: hypothetical protein V4812_03925 [Pseudomonadota bacterium]
MKHVLRLAGISGFLLFALACSATFFSPLRIEQAAQAFLQDQVVAQVNHKVDNLQHPRLKKSAGMLSRHYQGDIAGLQQRLRDGLPDKIAAIVGQMQDARCPCRNQLSDGSRGALEFRILALGQLQGQLVALIQGTYGEAVEQLLGDLRSFTGTNAAVFLFLLLLSRLKPRAIAQLSVPAVLLLAATLVSTYFYLFQQNWFFTLLHNDYLGYGYTAYLGVVFLLLCDVSFNRARVTTRLINALLDALGSATSVVPC